jgi:hypothetical protein
VCARSFTSGNTGWVGPSLVAIEAVLAGGNIREVWALLYALTKTGYVSTTLTALLSRPSSGQFQCSALSTPFL